SEPATGQTTTMAPADRSEQVFDAYDEPGVLGSSAGEVALARSSDRDPDEVTFEVTDVTVTPGATILRYQISTKDGDALMGMEGQHWYDQPTLHVPGTDNRMQSVTAA